MIRNRQILMDGLHFITPRWMPLVGIARFLELTDCRCCSKMH